nr:bifunctional hydroxymethylpyrimidine kinase/phosphomethylpyrimidine kinase [Planococcus lenghuensis]
MMKQVLTIAGSDSGGGAGIQADIKTFQELGVYSTSVLTAVTAQNTRGVHGIYPMTREAVEKQLDAIGTDFQIAALKTGMLFDAEIIEATGKGIQRYGWKNVVVDPVMIAKGGASLLQQEAVDALKAYLLPLAEVVTPNIPEAEVLSGIAIHNSASREKAAQEIVLAGAASVIIKGGHGKDPDIAEDFYMSKTGESFLIRSPRIDTDQTHGTGCTFSAAVAAELAKGQSMKNAIHTAKRFIQAALTDRLNIGTGYGPTNHAAFNTTKEANPIEVVH